MFRHILVPLDGSRLAESALGMAASLARRFDASLTLIHVIEQGAPSEVHSERHLVSAEEAQAYLDEVSRLSTLAGLRVSTHVHTAEVKDVADSITEHSAELAPDLIVMSTHGRGGARRLIFGDIAQQIISRGETPVLVVRPSADARAEGTSADWRIILAPIDGDPSHERGLPVASDLAIAFHCRLHLLMVVPTIGKLSGFQGALSLLLPGTTRVKLEMDSAGARDYLASKEKELQRAGVLAGSEMSRGDPARAIVKEARRLSADLVVLGTHGRAGTDAFWAGSVAAQVVARARAPLLLVPLKESRTES
ncbi:MAG TPA: universal stress protein [Spirochaetia bacterium]|nr:universal stress protein [Spirochaetia bacterium]